MKAMMRELRRGVLYTIVTMVLFGGVYHLLIESALHVSSVCGITENTGQRAGGARF